MAVSVVEFMKLVLRELPFHVTVVVSEVKFEPVAVNVNDGAPAVALFGEMLFKPKDG